MSRRVAVVIVTAQLFSGIACAFDPKSPDETSEPPIAYSDPHAMNATVVPPPITTCFDEPSEGSRPLVIVHAGAPFTWRAQAKATWIATIEDEGLTCNGSTRVVDGMAEITMTCPVGRHYPRVRLQTERQRSAPLDERFASRAPQACARASGARRRGEPKGSP